MNRSLERLGLGCIGRLSALADVISVRQRVDVISSSAMRLQVVDPKLLVLVGGTLVPIDAETRVGRRRLGSGMITAWRDERVGQRVAEDQRPLDTAADCGFHAREEVPPRVARQLLCRVAQLEAVRVSQSVFDPAGQ